jgi:hypothetical protein
VLTAGGRLVLADGTADRLLARIADRLLRRFDRGHVRLYQSAELIQLVHAAGFDEIAIDSLWNGGYAIVTAASRTARPRPPRRD